VLTDIIGSTSRPGGWVIAAGPSCSPFMMSRPDG
jgi:hypothetical protein